MLSAVEAEVSKQPDALKLQAERHLPEAPVGSLFVGAGDSLAAAGVASFLSPVDHVSLDPYQLISNPMRAKGRSVYFASVSGMTVSNLAASKAVKGLAKERIAVTANERGRLVAATDSAIFIPYQVVPRLPGTLSFSLTLLTLLALAGCRPDCNFSKIHLQARGAVGKIEVPARGCTYLLGNGAAFPLAMYSASKLQEILGAPAQAWMLEEFGHAGLFALGHRDAVNAFCAFDPLALAQRLVRSLKESGFTASAIAPLGSNSCEQVFYLVFLSQYAALRKAKSDGLQRPHFARARKKLAISDSMIY